MANVPYNREMIKKVDLIRIEKSIIDSINLYRKSQGKNILTYNPELSVMAREWSDSLVDESLLNNYGGKGGLKIYHSNNPYIENCFGVPYPTMSKIKDNFFNTKIPELVFNSWYKSKGHNAGMLMSGETIGVGVSLGMRDEGVMYIVCTMLIECHQFR